jgi:hypothetical protein
MWLPKYGREQPVTGGYRAQPADDVPPEPHRATVCVT